MNRVHNSHMMGMKAKEFERLNMSDFDTRNAPLQPQSTWDRLEYKSEAGSSGKASSGIKSSGFV